MFYARAYPTFSTITNLCPSQVVTYTVTQIHRQLGEAKIRGGGNDPRKPGSFDHLSTHAKDALDKELRKCNKQARRKERRERSREKYSRVCQDGGSPPADHPHGIRGNEPPPGSPPSPIRTGRRKEGKRWERCMEPNATSRKSP